MMRREGPLVFFSASRRGVQVVRKMLGPLPVLLVVVSKRRRIDEMCFSAPVIPPVEIKYEKQDFGPLKALPTGTPIARDLPTYGKRPTAQARSLLMPFTMGGS